MFMPFLISSQQLLQLIIRQPGITSSLNMIFLCLWDFGEAECRTFLVKLSQSLPEITSSLNMIILILFF